MSSQAPAPLHQKDSDEVDLALSSWEETLWKTPNPLDGWTDLHFSKQFSLLQLILFLLLELSRVTFLYQKQLLSDLVIYALHLGIT